jgi:hypothetical protein
MLGEMPCTAAMHVESTADSPLIPKRQYSAQLTAPSFHRVRVTAASHTAVLAVHAPSPGVQSVAPTQGNPNLFEETRIVCPRNAAVSHKAVHGRSSSMQSLLLSWVLLIVLRLAEVVVMLSFVLLIVVLLIVLRLAEVVVMLSFVLLIVVLLIVVLLTDVVVLSLTSHSICILA